MSSMPFTRLLFVLPSLAVACSAVLGIEDAEVDPNLVADGGENGNGASNTNGNDGGGTGGANGGNGRADAGMTNDSGASDAAPEGGNGGESLCEQYCSEIQDNCTGDLEIYPSETVCLATCATFPEGDPGTVTGNSVHCRLENAKLAATTGEPEVHCPAAGPGGDGICGENCEGFCTTMLAVCPDEYLSLTACREDCDALPDLGGFDDSIQAGNSVQCRLYHVGAATQVAAIHCPHAAGAAPCAE